MTKTGRRYEHKLSNAVFDATDGVLIPLGGGFNGATAWDVDMLIDDGEAVHVFELKRTGQDGYTLVWDPDDRSHDDLYGLVEFCINYPRPAYPYVGVRFNNKQLAVTRIYVDEWPDREGLLDSAEMLEPYDDVVDHTGYGNLRFHRAESIPSQASGNDAQHVLDRINYVL
jgi:hypothetical protein